jgi:adenosylcobinamide-phosphate synthase
MIAYSVAAFIAGFILDAIIGDPHGMPHPVCFFGFLISRGEKRVRRLCKETPKGERAAGMILSLCVLAFAAAVPALILFIASQYFWLWFVLETWMCYQILAAKSLRIEAMKVYRALQGDISEARRAVSMIVGRDTEALSREGIIKAVVETVAENTSDGITAPMLYTAIGGPALGWMYKAANTLDSMIGYKNDRYINFGRFAAKLDDVLNFIPARLTALFMIAAAFLLGMDAKNAWRIFRRDRLCHASPNSAQTESVCAGALNIGLAGDAYYFGKLVKKPVIGDVIRSVCADDIIRANRLSAMTSVLFLAACSAAKSGVIFMLTGGVIWKL